MKMIHKTLCEYCGEEKQNKGFSAHERACKRKHHGVKLTDRRRTPTFQSRSTIRTFTAEVPDQPTPPSDAELSLGPEMEQALVMFPKNSCLFGATLHLLLAVTDADPVSQLRKAQVMIEREIKSLGG